MDTTAGNKSERDQYNNFINACKNDNVDVIRYQIDVLKVDHISNKGFYYACRYNSVDVIRYFIEVLGVDYKSGKEFRWVCRYNSVDVIRYFIEVLKIDHISVKGFESACMYNSSVDVIRYFTEKYFVDHNKGYLYACQYNKCADIIKYFIEEHKTDPNNGFLHACQYNKSVDIIGYFIKKHQTDPNSGFLIACQYNHVNVIKYFIEVINVDYVVGDGFKKACWSSSSVDVIRYFIDVLKINIIDDNGFKRACASNSSLDIIKYFIQEHSADPYIGFHFACRFNSSVGVIRYFIEDLKLDPYKLVGSHNSFECVCSFNPSFEIFKYFVEELSIDINRRGDDDAPLFLLAYHNERNLDIIRYQIDVLRIDINMRNDMGEDIIDYAKKNNDQELIKYVINNTKYIIRNNPEDVLYIDNDDTLQQNIERWADEKYCDDHYIDPEDIQLLYNHLNQLLLTKEQIKKYNLVDPFSSSMEWNVFKNKVECVKRINKSHDHQLNDHQLNGRQMNRMDDEKIFTNNGIQYYGNQLVTYNQMTPLKCVLEMNNDEGFDLNQNISDYAMKLYLSKVEQSVDRYHLLDKKEFIGYIRLLDQYPLPNYTINTIELDILEYMINNKIPVDYLIIDIIERYNLRYLYAWTRNKLNCN